MTTTVATKDKAAREAALIDHAVKARTRRAVKPTRKADLDRKADELYRLLRDIQKRAGELFELVYEALYMDNAAWLEIYGTQHEVNSVQVDFIASPRDLNLLLCAVESNTPGRILKDDSPDLSDE